MKLLKLAGEVYELQGWKPPAKKPASESHKNPAGAAGATSSQRAGAEGATRTQ
jgi:hypothetical protein